MPHTLTLSPATNIAILVMALGQLMLVGALVFLAIKLKAIVSETVKQTVDASLSSVQPVIDNATRVTEQVSSLVEEVAPRIRGIAEDSERTVHTVATTVKTTSSIVSEGVAKPVANIAAVLAGLQRGLAVWKTAKAHVHGGEDHRKPDTEDPA